VLLGGVPISTPYIIQPHVNLDPLRARAFGSSDLKSRHPNGVQSSGDLLRFEGRGHSSGFRKNRVGRWCHDNQPHGVPVRKQVLPMSPD
jgi:hypothetical protein